MEALNNVKDIHARSMTQYRRLLEQAHGASASQLHALQAELRILRGTLEEERAITREIEMQRDQMQMQSASRYRSEFQDDDVDLASALKGDGKGGFDEMAVRKAVKRLKMPERVRL